MSNRPLGMYLVCTFFGLIGLGSVISGLSLASRDIPAGQPESVQLFLTAFPVFAFFLGLLGLFVAVTLWLAQRRGLIGGLIWTGLWLIQEVVIGIWAVTGPRIVRQASSGVGGTLIRLFVGGALFYYLWTDGATYVNDNSATPRSSTISREQ